MQQSNTIFAFLLVSFVVFITMRGELPRYMGFLLGGTSGGDETKAAGAAALAVPKFDTAGALASIQGAAADARGKAFENFGNVAKVVGAFL